MAEKPEKKYADTVTTIQELRDVMVHFVKERQWQEYHSPKNLSMSIAIEAAELMEKFQFLSVEESRQIAKSHKEEISHELADIFAYVLSFANACDIDLSSVFIEKVKLSAQKYPVEKSKGSFGKYTKLNKK